MIGILDYGAAGNIASVKNAFARIGAEAAIVKGLNKGLGGLVIPGVGSFSAVQRIRGALGGNDIGNAGFPVLGICLGMQALFDRSEEVPGVLGLGLVKGEVRRISGAERLPQLGWNIVESERKDELLEGVGGSYFYFANSYAAFPEDASLVISSTMYNGRFASAIRKGNVWGVQFHPEKSGKAGLRLLSNFAAICRNAR